MSLESDPDLQAALDGINAAVRYAEQRGLDDLASELGEKYQELGSQAPDEDWQDDGRPE